MGAGEVRAAGAPERELPGKRSPDNVFVNNYFYFKVKILPCLIHNIDSVQILLKN